MAVRKDKSNHYSTVNKNFIREAAQGEEPIKGGIEQQNNRISKFAPMAYNI